MQADAAVRAEPERQMAVLGPFEIERVRPAEDVGIVVGRSKVQHDPVTRAHALTVHLDLLGNRPADPRQRWIEAQELIEVTRRPAGLAQAAGELWVVDHAPKEVAERVRRSAQAADHQECKRPHLLVRGEGPAVDRSVQHG